MDCLEGVVGLEAGQVLTHKVIDELVSLVLLCALVVDEVIGVHTTVGGMGVLSRHRLLSGDLSK